MSDQLANFVAEITGHAPDDLALFTRAFTHGSHGGEDYQRLEFLGDRVLGVVIADALYARFPDAPEGELSQRLNALVAGSACAEIAETLHLADHIRFGKQAHDDGARQSAYILGDVMEALIGAIYVGHGLEVARAFILKHWEERIAGPIADTRHPKSRLQEWAAANRRKPPVYDLLEKNGPDHALQFTVKVAIANVGEAQATAASKQQAETAAARAFVERFL